MKEIEIEIEGTGEGLLMHSTKAMTSPTATKNPARTYDPKKDAEKASYRNKKGELIVPSRCLKASILNSASWYKFGRKSAKQIIAGCTRIEPSEVVLLDKKGKALKNYEIDVRPVVIQKSRIMRARPLINEWKLRFKIIYNEKLINDTKIIYQIIEEAGQRIGLLDNRPQRYGENGTFKVNKFVPKK